MPNFPNGPNFPIGSSVVEVEIVVQNNETWVDALQFDPPPQGFSGGTGGPPGATGPQWNLVGQNFRMDLKRQRDPFSAPPYITFSSTGGTGLTGGQIVTQDPYQRIISFNVPEAVFQQNMIPGTYKFDFVMYDGSLPPIRIALMHGIFRLVDGITKG